MLRAALLTLLVCAMHVPRAAAQPVTQPEMCAVSIVRAPADVAREIDTWVRAERTCATVLEVRVIPTVQGLYLLARYPDGRIRERVVPDARAAGVLVASWTSEDVPARAPLVAPPPLVVDPFAGAPGVSTSVVAVGAPPPARATRWLTFGGLVRTMASGGAGARGEIDLIARGPWVAGVAVSGSETEADPLATGGYFSATDLSVVGYLGRTATSGPWELRVAAGIGAVRSTVDAYLAYEPNGPWIEPMYLSTSGVFPMAQASVLMSRRFGNWAITAGPVVSWLAQSYYMGQQTEFARREGDLMLLGGVRHAL